MKRTAGPGGAQAAGANKQRKEWTMTDKQRLARLEIVLGTLIMWLHRELGSASATELLNKLTAPEQDSEASHDWRTLDRLQPPPDPRQALAQHRPDQHDHRQGRGAIRRWHGRWMAVGGVVMGDKPKTPRRIEVDAAVRETIDVENLAEDCRLVVECLKDTGSFPTGQNIALEAANALTAQADELANLRATNMELVAQVARLSDERDAAGFDDETADKMLRWLAKMLGVSQYDIADGSEEWDGDVRGTICNILKAGNIYDDEDGRVARLDDLHSTNKADAVLARP